MPAISIIILDHYIHYIAILPAAAVLSVFTYCNFAAI